MAGFSDLMGPGGSNGNMYQAMARPGQVPVSGAPQTAGGATGPNAMGLANAGANQLLATLQGKYLNPNSNPWLKQTANAATQGLVNQYESAIAPSQMTQAISGGGGPGALQGSAFQQGQDLNQYNLGQNIGNTEAAIYGGNYSNERANQMNGLGLLGNTQNALFAPGNELLGVGALEQQQQQQGFNTQYQNAAAANQYPMDMLSRFGSLLGQATGGTGNQLSFGTTSK